MLPFEKNSERTDTGENLIKELEFFNFESSNPKDLHNLIIKIKEQSASGAISIEKIESKLIGLMDYYILSHENNIPTTNESLYKQLGFLKIFTTHAFDSTPYSSSLLIFNALVEKSVNSCLTTIKTYLEISLEQEPDFFDLQGWNESYAMIYYCLSVLEENSLIRNSCYELLQSFNNDEKLEKIRIRYGKKMKSIIKKDKVGSIQKASMGKDLYGFSKLPKGKIGDLLTVTSEKGNITLSYDDGVHTNTYHMYFNLSDLNQVRGVLVDSKNIRNYTPVNGYMHRILSGLKNKQERIIKSPNKKDLIHDINQSVYHLFEIIKFQTESVQTISQEIKDLLHGVDMPMESPSSYIRVYPFSFDTVISDMVGPVQYVAAVLKKRYPNMSIENSIIDDTPLRNKEQIRNDSKSKPTGKLYESIKNRYEYGTKEFLIDFVAHGSSKGLSYLNAEDIYKIIQEFPDAHFTISTVACYGGNLINDFYRLMQNDKSLKERVTVFTQTKSNDPNYLLPISAGTNRYQYGAPVYYWYLTQGLETGKTYGEAVDNADYEALPYYYNDAESLVKGEYIK